MAKAFLLDEKQQKYYEKRIIALERAMIVAGVDKQFINESDVEKISKHLPAWFKPGSVEKKLGPILAGKRFSVMCEIKHGPSPREWTPGEKLKGNEFPLKGQLSLAYREWYYTKYSPDEKQPFNMQIMYPIEEGTPAYDLLESSSSWKTGENFSSPSESEVLQLQELLGLQEYPYIPLRDPYMLQLLDSVCYEIVQQGAGQKGLGTKKISTSLPAPYFGHGFNTIHQGIATNTLATLRPNKKGNTNIDAISHTATITTGTKHGDFILTLSIDKLKGLKTSTIQLLDTLVIELTERGAGTPTVNLSLSDYMERRKLKDRKSAREQFLSDILVLSSLAITWAEERVENRKKKLVPYAGVSVCDTWEMIDERHTVVSFTFGPTFYNVLRGYAVMPYPAQLQTINAKRNPNSFAFLRKIAEYKNQNALNPTDNYGDIISVKTLLSVAPDIPTYEKVMETNRNLMGRIVEPFQRDMNALEETLDWEYCHSKGAPLTEEEEANFDYSTFITALVKITWKQYPDQTARKERKDAQKEAATQKKLTGGKKKKPAQK